MSENPFAKQIEDLRKQLDLAYGLEDPKLEVRHSSWMQGALGKLKDNPGFSPALAVLVNGIVFMSTRGDSTRLVFANASSAAFGASLVVMGLSIALRGLSRESTKK